MNEYKLYKLLWAFRILGIIIITWIIIPFMACIIIRYRSPQVEILPPAGRQWEPIIMHLTIDTPSSTPTLSPTPTSFEVPYYLDYDSSLTLEEKEYKIWQCNVLLDALDYYRTEESLALQEYIRLSIVRGQYQRDLDISQERYEDYPTATTIWNYLTEEMELSDISAAGILGNIMVEAGGHSLHINPSAYNSAGYYGICQWSTSYHYEMNGASLETQLEYLNETLESEFRYSSVTYEQFINATNPRDASIYFARGYERCARPYERQNCAQEAYEYFCGDGSER